MANIIDVILAKKLFGRFFRDIKSWQGWLVFLKAVFVLPMDEPELAFYKESTGREKPPASPVKEAWAIVGRRGGKSFIGAIAACHLALFHDWTPYLGPGETGWIMCIASDRRQAQVTFSYLRAILREKPFKAMVEKELAEEIRLKNNIIISVKTCDYRTLRGFTAVAVLADEIAFWRDQGANPAGEILTALRPAMSTVPGSILLALSTPYAKSGPLWETFQRWGQEGDILVWRQTSKKMNPTLSDSLIEKALKEDYSAAKAEWLAEFREDLETFLSTELIESAIVSRRFELPYTPGIKHHGFVDPSGGRQDSMTMAIAHKNADSGHIILDRVEERKPPFEPKTVVKEFSSIFKEYGIYTIEGDSYAGDWVVSAFKDEGLRLEPSKKNKSEIYLDFEPLLAQGQIELLDNQTLFEQLRGLERRTKTGGRDKVDHFPGASDDISNSACGACVLANLRPNRMRDIVWLEDEPALPPLPLTPPPPWIQALCTTENVIAFAALLKADYIIIDAARKMGLRLEDVQTWRRSCERWIAEKEVELADEIYRRAEQYKEERYNRT